MQRGTVPPRSGCDRMYFRVRLLGTIQHLTFYPAVFQGKFRGHGKNQSCQCPPSRLVFNMRPFRRGFAVKLISLFLVNLILISMVACGGGGSGSTRTAPPPGGGAWEVVSTPFTATNFIDFGSNGHWFVADRAQGFFRSTDGGATWSPINSGIATNMGWSINVVPNSGALIAGIYSQPGIGVDPVLFYRSTNEGASWTLIPSVLLDKQPAWTGCAFASNGNTVCGGYWAASPASGGWYSSNSGQNIAPLNTTSTNGTAVFSLALNPIKNDMWMGTEQYGVFRSTDNGVTWSPASPPDTTIDPGGGIRDGNAIAITFDQSGNVLFASQGGIWKSSSNGSGYTWTNVKGNPTTADGLSMARDATGTLYYGHMHASNDLTSLYCSTDNGNTWTACDGGMPQGAQVIRMAVNPTDHKMYAIVWDVTIDQGFIYRTSKPVQ